ncbi:protein ACCELERATED CELL DEATH 6-like [Telopea speciosissima]|uniref:protein ACCELERATED CELL DEATH 6-like n=1 Tax=Telopea speciosissima TaxID=54955 RepID=UPI001CC4D9ED|nr:protein ACCELERATED CELL DEATH 6-like [Telopea speciosissima]
MDPRLYRSAVEGDIFLLRKVVIQAEQPDLLLYNITTQKNNVLHIAVRSSRKEFIKHVIRICPSLLAQPNSNGDTPLHIAAKEGLLEMLDLLVQSLCSVNPNVTTTIVTEELSKMILLLNGYPSLYVAESGGPLRVVPFILEASPLSLYTNSAGRTTLHQAIIANSSDSDVRGWAETFPEMIKKKDEYGSNPLHYASYFGFSNSVFILLQTDKSCAYEPDMSGMYAHLLAAQKGHDSVIRELNEHCPDCFELFDSQGRSALHIAAESVESERVFWFLTEKTHHHINLQDKRGYTPLLLASKNQNESVLASLRDHPKVRGSAVLERQLEVLRQVADESGREAGKVDISIVAGLSRRLKDKANIHLLVATIIATVSFAAGINMPGGYKGGDGPYQGMATLTKKAAFQVFVVSNSLAFCFSVASIAIHFMIIIECRVINRAVLLLCALFLTFVGLIGMVTAFISGTIAVLASSGALWVASSIICCCFFLVFYVVIGPPFRNRRGDGQEKDINQLHDREDESPFLYKLTDFLLEDSK